jgi:hypothetical protein
LPAYCQAAFLRKNVRKLHVSILASRRYSLLACCCSKEFEVSMILELGAGQRGGVREGRRVGEEYKVRGKRLQSSQKRQETAS